MRRAYQKKVNLLGPIAATPAAEPIDQDRAAVRHNRPESQRKAVLRVLLEA